VPFALFPSRSLRLNFGSRKAGKIEQRAVRIFLLRSLCFHFASLRLNFGSRKAGKIEQRAVRIFLLRSLCFHFASLRLNFVSRKAGKSHAKTGKKNLCDLVFSLCPFA